MYILVYRKIYREGAESQNGVRPLWQGRPQPHRLRWWWQKKTKLKAKTQMYWKVRPRHGIMHGIMHGMDMPWCP